MEEGVRGAEVECEIERVESRVEGRVKATLEYSGSHEIIDENREAEDEEQSEDAHC